MEKFNVSYYKQGYLYRATAEVKVKANDIYLIDAVSFTNERIEKDGVKVEEIQERNMLPIMRSEGQRKIQMNLSNTLIKRMYS